MRIYSILVAFLMLFFTTAKAQTYTPIGDKIVISVTQETPEGGEITTTSEKLDSASAANRFFQNLILTNQRIAELQVEIEMLRKQSGQSIKAYNSLSNGQNVNQRIADLYGGALIGMYSITDSTSKKDAQILVNNQGKLVLKIGATNYPVQVLSNVFFTVTIKDTVFEFVQRNRSTYVHSERGRKVILEKIE